MIFINESCPKCGRSIRNLFTATHSFDDHNECFNCGWNKNRETEDAKKQSYTRKQIKD